MSNAMIISGERTQKEVCSCCCKGQRQNGWKLNQVCLERREGTGKVNEGKKHAGPTDMVRVISANIAAEGLLELQNY